MLMNEIVFYKRLAYGLNANLIIHFFICSEIFIWTKCIGEIERLE